MSTVEGCAADTPQLKTGPPAANKRLDYLTSADVIAELLHKTQDFTDEQFNDLIDDIGARAVRLVMRAKAVGGDVRAADLYLKLVEQDREARRQHGKTARNITPSGFIQDTRDTTAVVADTTDSTTTV